MKFSVEHFDNYVKGQKDMPHIDTKDVLHTATPKNPSFSRQLNLRALPNALPAGRDFALRSAAIFPVFSAKGWLSLNWVAGCNLGCAYCYRATRKEEEELTKPVQLYDEGFVADFLMSHPFFVPHFRDRQPDFIPTVIGLHTSSTEPFLNGVRDKTIRMLKLLDSKGLMNPVVIITKWYLNEDEIADLEASLHNISLYISICYSAMPSDVEPVSAPETAERRKAFMDRLSVSKVLKPIHYYRPIALGWNDSEEQIMRALRFGSTAPSITAGGVTLWSTELELIEKLGIKPPLAPEGGWIHYGYRRKWFPKTLERRIIEIKNAMGLESPLFRRASCNVSFREGIADYNGYRTEDHKNCTECCPPEQVARCEAVKAPDRARVEAALEKMKVNPKFEIKPEGIELEQQEDKFALLDAFSLRHMLGFPATIKKQ